MKTDRLTCSAIREIAVEERELGPVPDDGILVQTQYSAVSVGTELWDWMHGANPGGEARFPRGTGYCSTGIVLEVGKDVTRVQPGDRVAGSGNHASHNIMTGLYHKVPEGVSPKSAAFLTMAAIAMHGVRVARIELGEAVAVTGMGLVGQFALSLSKLNGGQPVIAVDIDDFRLEKARARGADACLNPETLPDVVESVRALCVEDGANVVIEATGKPVVYPMAVKLACVAGRFVALGSPRGTVEFNFLDELHLREVSMLGAIQPRTPEQDHIYFRWTKERERSLILRLMAEGKLPAEDLATHVAKPGECQDIYTMLADRPGEAQALGVLFDWQA